SGRHRASAPSRIPRRRSATGSRQGRPAAHAVSGGTGRARDESGDRLIKGLATAGALVAYNTVTNIWHHTDRTYLLRNAAAAVALLVLARHSGLSWSDLGLGRSDLQSGWRWGGMTAGGIAAAAGLGVLALRHRHVGRRMLAD